jgi:heptosyltransferase-2
VSEVRRLLVRAPNWVGDVVLSLPALRDLRRNFPGARMEVLARRTVADLYRAVPEVEAVRAFDAPGEASEAARGFDLAVILPNSFASAWQVFRARVPQRWGRATDGRGLLLTRRALPSPGLGGRSQVYYYRAMLAGLGLAVSASPDASLSCPTEWRSAGERLLGGGDGWVGLAPGASFGPAKRWPPSRYAAVGDALARHGFRVVLLGSPAEEALSSRVASGMLHSPLDLAGRTSLPELVGVLSGLRLLVTNDSGPMHLAAALGTPLVAVFGPTDERETAPGGDRARLLREPVSCAPCLLRECPIDHRCMRRVGAERVATEALALLAEPAQGAPGGRGPS